MPEKVIQTLDGVSETLFLPLQARARESQRPNPLIRDDKAVEIVSRIAFDTSRLRMQRHDEIAVIMRVKKFDGFVRNFLGRNPAGVVVHIGCGLDTRFERVDNGQVEWFDLDMPAVIALRKKLFENGRERYHMLASSVFEDGWLPEVERFKSRPFLFVAEGVLPYFEETQVKGLFLKLRQHFPGCELACDVHTPFVIWADNIHLALTKVEARMHWSVKHAKDLESWAEGIRLLEAWNYYQDDEDNPLKALRWVRLIPFIAESSGIAHYRLGERL